MEAHRYDDIINLPHHRSAKRVGMSMIDRAAQFSPFAALTGYEAAIQETARCTGRRIDLTEGEKLRLNETIQELSERIGAQPEILVTRFQEDPRKDGGEYVTVRGKLRKIDPYGRGLILTDGQMILFEDIVELEEV